ncbi:hypothetical protein DYB32_009020 [Aphanomyces invadans]|uniref:BZIP domain-containing protein n=1 Tax=Aphanomyces invadans TaxID=157072 RepID=A0A3R6VR68_9STRA|nr:hypothetical protein DYB32_009020 [Aphanomyces invadans]
MGPPPTLVALDRAEAQRVVRRHRSKMCMRRHRAKKKALNARLEEYVREVQLENLRLQAHLAGLYDQRGVSLCIATTSQYTKLFEFGYSPTRGAHARRQEAFLAEFAAPHVNYNGQIGVKHILNQWAMYDALFGSVHVACMDITVVTVDVPLIVLEATYDARVVVTGAAVQALFPHLVNRPDLVDKLIGSTMLLPLRVLFSHDMASHRVTRVQATASVVVALVALLKNVDDADMALQGALLVEDLHLNLDAV